MQEKLDMEKIKKRHFNGLQDYLCFNVWILRKTPKRMPK